MAASDEARRSWQEVCVTKENVRASGRQTWSLNNTALKSIRDTHEDPPGTPTTNGVDLFDQDPFLIKTLVRDKGMDYQLVEPEHPWSWRAMLNGMTDTTLERVVGSGITGISCKPMPQSYDQTASRC